MTPLPSSCDGFAQAIVLRIDRELGPAESDALDRHLDLCARCRARTRRIESLATVLKGWDARANAAVVPPARLKGAILAEVSETAHVRRLRGRRFVLGRVAVAACVLLALGTGLLLGDPTPPVRGSGPVTAPPPVPTVVASRPPRKFPPLDVSLPDARPFPPLPPRVARPVSRDVLDAALAVVEPMERAASRERAFLTAYGEPGVWWTPDVPGLPDAGGLLVSVYAAEYLRTTGLLLRLSVKSQEPVYAATRSEATEVTAGEALGLPAEPDRLLALLHGLAWSRTVPSLAVAQVPPAPTLGLAGGIEGRVLDATEAVRTKVATFKEDEDHDDLVYVFVAGNRSPIFLPAGEILAGGRRDRVVAQATWIPAGEDRRPFAIRCAAVSSMPSEYGAQPAPTGLVAGPAVRALLARGGTSEQVLDLVRRQVSTIGFRGVDVTLMDVYRQVRRDVVPGRVAMLQTALEGIVVEDAAGRFLGYERTMLPPKDAAGLLGRLLVGYEVEEMLDLARRAREGAVEKATEKGVRARPAPEAGAGAGGGAAETLSLLLEDGTTLRATSEPGRVRLGRMGSSRAGISLDSLTVDGKPVLVSALAPR